MAPRRRRFAFNILLRHFRMAGPTNIIIAGVLIAALALSTQSLRSQTPTQLDRDAVLHHLNAVITWYRDATSKIKSVGLPSDTIYQDNARNLAAQAVRLAFQSARAEANILSPTDKTSDTNSPPSSSAPPTQQQNLAQTAAKVAAQIDDAQLKLDAVNKQVAAAPKNKRQQLLAQRDQLQGQLALNKALQDTIQKMAAFVEGANEGSEGLDGSINQLARSVPEAVGDETGKKPAPTTPAANATPASSKPTGLIGQSLALFDQMQTMHQIDQMADETSKMRNTADSVRKPLRDILVATIKRGRELSSQPQAPAAGSSQATAQEYQSLTAKFKELSSATLPLSQEIVVLDQSRSNFQEWRKSIVLESQYELRGLLTRLIGENIVLHTSLAADLGAVRMDPAQVQQILLNLVLNARDAMPDGGQITLTTRNCTGHLSGSESTQIVPWVELTVADTGGGMDAETLDRAFEPFFTTKNPGRGNGLGLATARRLARLEGGTIVAESELGKGTRISVRLPRVPSDTPSNSKAEVIS